MLRSFYQKKLLEAGCDEAGRGCLAGPVFAAAVILPRNFKHPLLNDSKLLSKQTRDELRVIIEQQALSWSVAKITPKVIDNINILNASFKAMHHAIKGLNVTPELLLIDGNRFNPYKKINYQCIIKGDSKFASIAAASILAKTHRDEYMLKKHKKFPQYAWNTNKGYPTVEHRTALLKHGTTPLHRRTFNLSMQGIKDVKSKKD